MTLSYILKVMIHWIMNKLTREEIRANFNDFRYLSSVEEPNIMREFVRYEDVVKLINKIQNNYN